MRPDDSTDSETVQRTAIGRPKLGQARRVRITTTIEPSKLALLREHARRAQKSLGQLADEYVRERFPLSQDPPE
jgi:hypothetical protein